MKKLALNAIVLAVFGSAFAMSACGEKKEEVKVDTEVTTDTITNVEQNVTVDSINKDSAVIIDSTVVTKQPVKVETTTTTTEKK